MGPQMAGKISRDPLTLSVLQVTALYIGDGLILFRS